MFDRNSIDLERGETGLSEILLIIAISATAALTGVYTRIYDFLLSNPWGSSLVTSYSSLIGFATFGGLYLLNDPEIGDWNTASFRWLAVGVVWHLGYTLSQSFRSSISGIAGGDWLAFVAYAALAIGIYKADDYGIGGEKA